MTIFPFLGLLLLTAGWFLLPLIPALRELFAPTDTAPLDVVGRDAGDVAFFARRFRTYLVKQLELLPAGAGSDQTGRLPDGTALARIERHPERLGQEAQDRVVVVEAPVALPGGETFLREVYARDVLRGGPGSVYRAVLGERDVTLGERSRVLRWIHAVGPLEVQNQSELSGRTSSDTAVELGAGITFERIGAPIIATAGRAAPAPSGRIVENRPAPWSLPAESRPVGDHIRVSGELNVPSAVTLDRHLVVDGSFRLGQDGQVLGSVKAHGDATLDRRSRVDGSLVSRRGIIIREECLVAGPVVAEESVEIGDGTTIGSPDAPTTVTAPSIMLGRGVTIYGQVVATRVGRTT